ncbi:hypothetical protein SAMN05216188_11927 [Lentzea xinjiangensis]|uniref:Uncharacterized protein n=1 Tax=Lentzea xinjiangensis TaxID=402600 RepID=A0A1H9TRW9_9PSEU|nr:hypothetical protein SAMN05216188_11927 [Lentzea xinjiangensis]
MIDDLLGIWGALRKGSADLTDMVGSPDDTSLSRSER